jgi:hypothetical protein
MLHIFVPLFLFVNQELPEKNDLLYAVLFALLLIPKDYARLPLHPEVSLSVLLTPIIMLFMAIVVVVEEARNRRTARDADRTAHCPTG